MNRPCYEFSCRRAPAREPDDACLSWISSGHGGEGPGELLIMSLITQWPLSGLRLATSRLELRLPSLDELAALASLAAEGVHDPAVQPFTVAWTDVAPEQRAQSVLQYHWRCWGEWQPENWELNLVVLQDGVVVGTQGISARDFAIRREVHTGSWLGRGYHHRGLGTEMRAAVRAGPRCSGRRL